MWLENWSARPCLAPGRRARWPWIEAPGRVFVGGRETEETDFEVTVYDELGNQLQKFGAGMFGDELEILGGGDQIAVDQGTGHVFVGDAMRFVPPEGQCCESLEARLWEFAELLPPSVETEQATVEASRQVTLNATVDPEGSLVLSCKFEYGPTAAYGSSVPCDPDPGLRSSSTSRCGGSPGVPTAARLTPTRGITFDSLPQYSADVKLEAADMNRIVVERLGSAPQFGGKVDAELRLNGRGLQMESLVGDGRVHVHDADIGELPLLVSLLKVLRSLAPNKTAFNQSEVAFRLQGRHIYLDQIDFLGDAVNLYGQGETNFDQQLNLVFSPSVARNDSFLPAIKNLMGQVNQQIMQMYVTGTLSNPQVSREAFPKINKMLATSAVGPRKPRRRRRTAGPARPGAIVADAIG